jgi:FkbM family methyltransferase
MDWFCLEWSILCSTDIKIDIKVKLDFLQVGSHIGPSIGSDLSFFGFTTESNVMFIEPSRVLMSELKLNCDKYYPGNNFILLNCGCGDQMDELDFWFPNVPIYSEETKGYYEQNNLPIWVDQLGSFDRDWIKKHDLQVEVINQKVLVVTLEMVCDKFRIEEIDWLMIDCEGWDLKVISGFNFEKLKPRKITIEVFRYTDSEKLGLIYYLMQKGYILIDFKDLNYHFILLD